MFSPATREIHSTQPQKEDPYEIVELGKEAAALRSSLSFDNSCFSVLPVDLLCPNPRAAPATGQAVQGQTAAQPEGTVLNLVNWVCNVIAPVGAALASSWRWSAIRKAGRGALGGHRGGLLMVSGLTRLIEFWIQNGQRGAVAKRGAQPMTLPQILVDLMKLLFDMAVPAAICTMVLAGVALRQEGGVNFQAGGHFQRWALWSVILLTLPQFLSWFAAQGISMPPQGGNINSPWVASVETSFNGFVSNVVVAKLTPVLAAFCVLKAALDAAEGHSPLGSIIAAIFLLSASGTVQLMQSWNSGTEFATTDMLTSAWNFLAGTILPEAAGLAVVGAIFNYARHRPFMPLVGSGLAFLSVSAIWKLVLAMVG